jgi:hypothetical protein
VCVAFPWFVKGRSLLSSIRGMRFQTSARLGDLWRGAYGGITAKLGFNPLVGGLQSEAPT